MNEYWIECDVLILHLAFTNSFSSGSRDFNGVFFAITTIVFSNASIIAVFVIYDSVDSISV